MGGASASKSLVRRMILSMDAEPGSRADLLRRVTIEGASFDELARNLRISRTELDALLKSQRLMGHLVSNPSRRRVADAQVARYEAGAALGEIAFELELRQEVATQALCSAGASLRQVDVSRLAHRPTGIPRAVLEQQLVVERRPTRVIADDHAVSRQRVYQLLRRYGLPTTVVRGFDPASVLSRRNLRDWLVNEHLSVPVIAERTGLKKRHVYELMRRWNLTRPPLHARLGVTEKVLRRLYTKQGHSIASAAETLGVTQNVIRTAMRAYGIPARSKESVTSRGMAAVLTAGYLAQRFEKGESIYRIAKELSVSRTTVEKYARKHGLSSAFARR